MQTVFKVRTSGAGLHEFTDEVVRFVRDSGVREGLLTLFVQHTSCSLLVQENADPDVRRDLQEFFRRLIPSSDDPSMRWLTHTTEGPNDMPAHIKAALITEDRKSACDHRYVETLPCQNCLQTAAERRVYVSLQRARGRARTTRRSTNG